MLVTFHCHGVQKITAKAVHSEEFHWVCLTTHEAANETRFTIFFDGADAARLADEYAHAVNSVAQHSESDEAEAA